MLQQVFVGRERELRELEVALENARAARGSFFLVAGEPGIGKSRLLGQVAERASSLGFRTLQGDCREAGGARAFWPWVRLLRSLTSDLDPSQIVDAIGGRAPLLAGLVPELRQRAPALPEPPPFALESDQARFYLFDAVATLLGAVSLRTPLLLALDDLHAADVPSLLLLLFIARGSLRHGRIVLVGTYREIEAKRRTDPFRLLDACVHEGRLISLSGLGEGDVASLAASFLGTETDAARIASLHRATGGNPFFVREILRAAAETPHDGLLADHLPVPAQVRTAVRARLDRLSEDCIALLTTAAAIGQEFGLRWISAACDLSEERVLAAIDEAVVADVVLPVPARFRQFAFSHALVRESLYQEIPPGERARLHRRLGEELERLCGEQVEPRLAELAHHSCEGARDGSDPGKAIEFSHRAGDGAASLLAYEEAAAHYRRALELLELAGPATPLRADLCLRLGDVLNRAGSADEARQAFVRAAELARSPRDVERFARAALGYGVMWLDSLAVDPTRVALLEEALRFLGTGHDALRARLLGRLALALYWSDREKERMEASEHAVEIARYIDDPATLAYALEARHYALWQPDHVESRLAAAVEMIDVAGSLGDPELELRARTWRFLDLVELGDVHGADRELESRSQLAAELREPQQLSLVKVSKALRAQLDGRFDEAERLAREAHEIGRFVQPLNADIRLWSLLFVCRRERGCGKELEEVEAFYRGLVERGLALTTARCCVALLALDSGRTAEARALFELLAEEDFAAVVADVTWYCNASLAAELCAALGDAGHAAVLYRQLLPQAARTVIYGAGLGCGGSLARHLGLLAETAGRRDDAVRHFEEALETNQRIGARPYVAHVQHEYARALLARGNAVDREPARALLSSALETAATLHMEPLRATVARFCAANGVLPGEGAALPRSNESFEANVFRFEDDFWTVAFEGKVVRLPDAKGIRYLSYLLARPGSEIALPDLVSAIDGKPTAVSAEQLRINVTKAVKATIRKLESLHSRLGRHLDGTVRTGRILSYTPAAEEGIVWERQ